MICELERLIELGNLIGKNTAGEVEVQFYIYTAGRYRDGSELETWIFFYDKDDNITASYFYRNSAVVLNILTMIFNESREK